MYGLRMKKMKLTENELLALLSGLNHLTSKEEHNIDTNVGDLYHKIEKEYYNIKRSHHYECDI